MRCNLQLTHIYFKFLIVVCMIIPILLQYLPTAAAENSQKSKMTYFGVQPCFCEA
jgi:hypothetical protein